MSSPPVIVIDNGSGFIKVGIAGNEAPKSVFPSIIGTPKSDQLMVGGQNKDYFVGYEAVAKKDLLNLRYPIENGVINNWDDIERIWRHSFYDELHIVPDDYAVLVTEKPLTQRTHREKLMQIMFETFNVKAYNSQMQPILALFSLGKTAGIVYDSGEGVSQTVSIYEGYGITHTIVQSAVSGNDLTKFLHEKLKDKNVDLSTANQIKERACKVALDYATALQEKEDPIPYTLPDGSVIELGTERITCPELFFQPSIIGAKCESVHQGILNSITKCEKEIQSTLFSNIVLAGGSTMFRGLPERIQKEIVSLAPPSEKVNVIATAGRRNAVWLGGSVIASLEAFSQMSIEKAEFAEEGISIVHRKCYC